MKNEIKERLLLLQQIYKSSLLYPFPYQDCRKILKDKDDEYANDFVPSLDIYFSDVAGCASWGNSICNWETQKIESVRNLLRKSFYQRFPKFLELKSRIAEKETPTLYKQLLVTDLMRLSLLDVLSDIKAEKIKQSNCSSHFSPVG